MIKLTDLEGRPFWVKPGTVTLVREPFEKEYAETCKCVIFQGTVRMGVRETIAQVMGALGQV
jgi:hypothetical protein